MICRGITTGLVGKPSAGKSTFFNAATAFARQRGENNRDTHPINDEDEDSDFAIGGAAMAPHPFTTIDPNVGFCLVPAPEGSCPEDEDEDYATLVNSGLILGSTHGRDSQRRRLIPVCLKDVAGLVPGAYQGRGKGNKVCSFAIYLLLHCCFNFRMRAHLQSCCIILTFCALRT